MRIFGVSQKKALDLSGNTAEKRVQGDQMRLLGAV